MKSVLALGLRNTLIWPIWNDNYWIYSSPFKAVHGLAQTFEYLSSLLLSLPLRSISSEGVTSDLNIQLVPGGLTSPSLMPRSSWIPGHACCKYVLSFTENIYFKHNENWSYLYLCQVIKKLRNSNLECKKHRLSALFEWLVTLFFFVFFVCVPRSNPMIFFK